MVQVTVTENLQRHHQVPAQSIPDGTLRDVLAELFRRFPGLQSYVFDEQQALRPHVMLAIDDHLIQGDISPWYERTDFSRVHIMQALSGG